LFWGLEEQSYSEVHNHKSTINRIAIKGADGLSDTF
jgi:hypothetical protein